MIKLNHLTMKHFMCVSNADLDFSKDKIIIFTGPNGNGKSTVQSAISLCLTEDKRSDSYKEFVQSGFNESEVSLNAEIKGVPIQFDIKLHLTGRTPFERKVKYNGKEYNNSEVTDLLDSFDIKYYSDIIMSTQGSGDDIVKLSPTQRERYLQKLLNFDFDDQVQVCKGKIDECLEKIKTNQQTVDFNEDAIKSRKGEIKELKEVTFSDFEMAKVSNDIEALTAKLNNYSTIIRQKDLKTEEKLKKKEEINSHQQDIKDYENRVNEIKRSVAENEKYQKLVKEAAEKIKVLNSELIEKQKSYSEVSNEFNNISSSVDEIKTKVLEQKVKTDSLLKKYQLMKQGKCPTCSHEFDGQELKETEAEISQETKTSVSLNDSLVKENASLISIKEKKEKAFTALNEKKNEVTTETRVRDGYERSIDKTDYSSKLSSLDSLISAHNSSIETLTSELEIIEKALTDFNEQTKDYENVSQELTEKQAILNDMNRVINENNAIMSTNNAAYTAIEASQKKIDESRENIEKYRTQQKTYDEVSNILTKVFPNYLIVKTCAKLEKEMNDFIQVVFPKMEVRLFQNKKGVEFFYTTDKTVIKDWKKENLINVKMASGFEKSCLSTAFKIALCKAYSLPFAFLDEIDCYGDEVSAEHLFESLVSNDIFDQLFIISHKPNVRDMIESRGKNIKTYYVKNGNFTLNED